MNHGLTSDKGLSAVRPSPGAAKGASNQSRLEECYGEMALLGEMIATAQDRITELEEQNLWLREAASFLLERGKWWWRFMPSAWQRRNRERRLQKRRLFDATTYSNRYPDVAKSGQDPFRHYIYHGVAENRRGY